jgi:hypothetical protein
MEAVVMVLMDRITWLTGPLWASDGMVYPGPGAGCPLRRIKALKIAENRVKCLNIEN